MIGGRRPLLGQVVLAAGKREKPLDAAEHRIAGGRTLVLEYA